MPLYVFEHQHTAETCPTNNEELMKQLAQHTTNETAATYGIRIDGEAVVTGEHRLIMILEADNLDRVNSYAQPFSMVGSVSVKPALTCEQVVVLGCG
ncbi:MAG TPA: DUF3303 family protein [Dehalococcoidia bacterium]|nr:DUF3303 family protein [Dehalococcoidia bacterium]